MDDFAAAFLRSLQRKASEPYSAVEDVQGPATVEATLRHLRPMYRNQSSAMRLSLDQYFAGGTGKPEERLDSYETELKSYTAQLDRVMVEMGRKPPAPGRIGMLEPRTPGAHTIRISSDSCVVVVDSDNFILAWLIAKILIQAVPPGDQCNATDLEMFASRVSDHLQSHPEAVRRLLDVVVNYASHGAVLAAEPYVMPIDSMLAAARVNHAMQMFVVAHEYGHLDLHDRGATSPTAKIDIMGRAALDSDSDWNWGQEVTSDTFGCQLVIAALETQNWKLQEAYAAVELYFTAWSAIDRLTELFRTGSVTAHSYTETTGTHPPADFRRYMLRTHLRDLIRDNQPNDDLSANIPEDARMKLDEITFLYATRTAACYAIVWELLYSQAEQWMRYAFEELEREYGMPMEKIRANPDLSARRAANRNQRRGKMKE